MPCVACAGAKLMCTFGAAPGLLMVLPINKVGQVSPVANILDHKPIVNIPPFGMCVSPANPAVIAATSAALGVFTPAPCIPATTVPWVPSHPTMMVGPAPGVTNLSTLLCQWGGLITVLDPGQTKVV